MYNTQIEYNYPFYVFPSFLINVLQEKLSQRSTKPKKKTNKNSAKSQLFCNNYLKSFILCLCIQYINIHINIKSITKLRIIRKKWVNSVR